MKKSTFLATVLTLILTASVIAGVSESSAADLLQKLGSNPGEIAREAAGVYMEGDYAAAAELYVEALLSDLGDNPVVLYNLSCCYGLLGEEELAGDVLVMAAEAGFDRLEMVNTDPDFLGVMDGEYFQESLARAQDILDENAYQESEIVLGNRLFLEFPSFQTIRVHLPADYDPDESRDLVLALHGYSGDVTEFSSRWDAFEEADFIFASLQAPYAFERNGRTVYSWTVFGSSQWDGEDMPEEQMNELYASSMDLSSDMVVAAAEQLTQTYDVGNIYLLGFSQGGIMTYWAAMRHPELFSGIATFSGVLAEETASDELLESASNIPVFLGRGSMEDDRALLARDRLMEAGFDVTFHQYQGGHYFPDSSLRAFESWVNQQ